MKKTFYGLLVLLFCCFIFTSFSPSLDGRAVVADEGAMPQGIFARTVGYLPGDSISVTNLAKKTTVDILVIGALDPSEGVAILLSKEAADLLGIEKGGNNIVKITKRSGQLDETVSGTAVIGASSAVMEPDSEGEEFPAGVETVPSSALDDGYVENPSYTDYTDVYADDSAKDIYTDEESASESGIAQDSAGKDNIEKAVDTYDDEKAVSPVQAEAVENEDISDSSGIEPESVVYEEIQATAEPDPEEKEPEKESVEYSEVQEERIPEEQHYEIEEKVPSPEKAAAESVAEEFFVEEAVVEEKIDDVPEKVSPDAEKCSEDDGAFSEKDTVSSEPYSEELPADGGISEVYSEESVSADELGELEYEQPDEKTKPAVMEEEVVADPFEESGGESYEPIILVPAAPNPPVKSSTVEIDSKVEPEEMPAKKIGTPSAENVKVAEKTENVSAGYNFEKYTVPTLKELKSGKYYVQIGVYGDKENIKAVFDKYGKKYPVTLVPLASGKATQVLIGPLGVDEYGTVLNRFRSYGYKDAFLRKIR